MRNDWEIKTLGDGFMKDSSNLSINKLKDDEGDYPFYSAKGFVKNISFYHQEKSYLAIIKDGAGVGRVSLHPAKSSVVGTLQYLLPKEGFDLKFLYYYLLSVDFSKYFTGSTIPHIYFKDYKSEPFPVVALNDQKEIVEILDQAFESIEKAKANIEKNIQNAKELFQSKLNHIFSQTGDDWNQVSIESLCNKTKNINWKENTDREFDYIDLSSVSRTSLTVTETKKIDSKNAPSRAKKIVKENDIIFGTTRPTLKRATKINEKYNNQICSTGFVVLSPKDPKDSEWIFYFLLSNKFMKRMESLQRGASYPAVSDNDVKKSILSIPSKESIKTQMIENLDALDNHIQSVLLAYNEELKNLEELKKSILQKAFSGELTNKNKAA